MSHQGQDWNICIIRGFPDAANYLLKKTFQSSSKTEDKQPGRQLSAMMKKEGESTGICVWRCGGKKCNFLRELRTKKKQLFSGKTYFFTTLLLTRSILCRVYGTTLLSLSNSLVDLGQMSRSNFIATGFTSYAPGRDGYLDDDFLEVACYKSTNMCSFAHNINMCYWTSVITAVLSAVSGVSLFFLSLRSKVFFPFVTVVDIILLVTAFFTVSLQPDTPNRSLDIDTIDK